MRTVPILLHALHQRDTLVTARVTDKGEWGGGNSQKLRVRFYTKAFREKV